MHALNLVYFPQILKKPKLFLSLNLKLEAKQLIIGPFPYYRAFSKILEKAVYDGTINFLNDHSMLSPAQYGFRSNFSKEYAVLDIMNTRYDHIERKMYSGLVLLDLAKAFGTVIYHTLLQKLEHYGTRGIVLQFY